jgi:hypothetical protein
MSSELANGASPRERERPSQKGRSEPLKNFKTELCKNFMFKGGCEFGDRCAVRTISDLPAGYGN